MTRTQIEAAAIAAGREAIAKLKDRDEAPHTAKMVRSGAWDDQGEVKLAIAGAREALLRHVKQ